MVTGCPHLVVSFNESHVSCDSHFIHVYMHNVIWLLTKCFLLKRAQLKDLISRLYNYMAVDRFGYANYSQSTHREYAQHIGRTLPNRFSFTGVR